MSTVQDGHDREEFLAAFRGDLSREEFLAALADMDKPDALDRLGRVLKAVVHNNHLEAVMVVLAIVAGLGFAMLVFVHWD